MNYIYVLDSSEKPLMPTTRYGWVRRALKSGRAKAVSTVPFTIRLTYEPETRETQRVYAAQDPGRTNIGLAAVTESGKCLYAAHCETRNKDIKKLMDNRRAHRQASRRGERLARKRLAKRLGTTRKGLMTRILPGCEKPLQVKDIINTESRFNNRAREKGWLTPTATQLLRTHLNLIGKVCQILPVTDVCVEINKFAFVQLDNPELRKRDIDFQHGPLYGFENAKAFISEMQEGKCLLCGGAIEHYHHIIPRYRGGSDTVSNLAGVCLRCHDAVHKDQAAKDELDEKRSGMYKKYAGVSTLNQVIPQLLENLRERFPGHLHLTRGWDIKTFREDHGIDKEHSIDAYCIACSALEDQAVIDVPAKEYEIMQYRRHDRARINSQRERTYKLDGKKVATNRRKRMEQKTPALDDWYQHTVEQIGQKEADRLRSKLTVEKSVRRYNNRNRMMPGAVFLYEGKRYVLSSQLTGGQYYRAEGCGKRNFSAKRCRIIQQNTGLTYM